MNPANYKELAHWISVSKATDPNQKIIAYLSGPLTMVNNPAAWQNIAYFCRLLITQYGVDGINLDFEPYDHDNPNYLHLFSAVRDAIGPTAHMSLDYTSDMTHAWSAPFFEEVSRYFTWIMPMLYDSECTDAACYRTALDQVLRFQYASLAPGVKLVPIVPTYLSTPYHDAGIEDICSAANAISNLVQTGAVKPAGLAVWWYYGWDSKAEGDWQTCWLDRNGS